MANDCLVTKLKGVVDNDNLMKLGEVDIQISDVTQTVDVFFNIISTENVTLENYTQNFVDVNKQDTGINKKTGTSVSAFALQGDKIAIYPKYSITSVSMSTFFADSGFTPKDINYMSSLATFKGTLFGDLDDITEVNRNMVLFTALKGSLSGHLASLTKFSNVREIKLGSNGYNVEGNLQDLAPLTSLKILHLGECGKVAGSIEAFVLAQVALGRSTVSSQEALKCGYFSMTNITFNGQPITSLNVKDLYWQPNALDSSKTDITFDGVTVTVPISVV